MRAQYQQCSRRQSPQTKATIHWRERRMDKDVFCVTHWDTLQISQQAFVAVSALYLFNFFGYAFKVCFVLGWRSKRQRAEGWGQGDE